MNLRLCLLPCLGLLLSACATTPGGRTQIMLVDDRTMNQMGATAFDQLKTARPLAQNTTQQRYVQCVASALIEVLPTEWRGLPWEVQVFEDDTPNAFALPGGKVGVHTGIFQAARSADQLAAVIGHELAHVTYRHGGERVSQNMAAEVALGAVQAYVGGEPTQQQQIAMAAIGLGAQVGVLMPFSRRHETEADLEGQRLMLMAGFDPREAAQLWQNMQSLGGAAGPEVLSSHPNPGNRVRNLQEHAATLMADPELARQRRNPPNCR